MPPAAAVTNQGVVTTYPGTLAEASYIVSVRLFSKQTTKRAIFDFHGHGGDATHGLISGSLYGSHSPAIARCGFTLAGAAMGGPTNWGLSACMAAVDLLHTWATTILGAQTKVGLRGYSMGAVGALNWAKRNPTKVGRIELWEPVTDMDWAHSTPGYVPAHSGGLLPNNAAWTSEIEAACAGGNYANSAGYRIRDEYSSWAGLCPIRVVHASDDTLVDPSQSAAFVTGVNDPQVVLRTPAPTGGHTAVFAQIPKTESADWWGQPW